MKVPFIILCLSLAVSAQSAIPIVEWSSKAECANVLRLKAGTAAECDGLYHDGLQFRYILHDGLFIAAAFYEEGKYIVGDFYFTNKSDQRILLDPSSWGVLHYKTIEDRLQVKPMGKAYTAYDPQRVAGNVQSRVAWANALGAFSAAMARTQSTYETTGIVRDNQGNTGTYRSTGTVTVPDRAAQARESRNQQMRNIAAASRSNQILSSALRTTTLLPEQTVSGLVYFDRNKKAAVTDVGILTPRGSYYFPIVRK